MQIQGRVAWNNMLQRVAHNIAEARILRNMNKGWENIGPKEQAYLKELGIDENWLPKISAMQQKYGYDIRGTHVSNSHMWSDQVAKERFNNAIRVEVHKSPLIVELGDIGRFFQKTEFRKSMILGQGFKYAAMHRILLSAAARRDPQALVGILSLIGSGMLAKGLADKISGNKSDYSLKEWIMHGLDRSGAGGIFMDPLMRLERAVEAEQNYGSRADIGDPIDYLLGPNGSVASAVYRATIEKLAGKPISKRTLYQVKQLIPAQNLWWFRVLTNKGNK
jgi:hypothetical protein